MVNVHEAKTHLSRLLNRVGEGEEVVIGDDFDSPLPDDLLKTFLT